MLLGGSAGAGKIRGSAAVLRSGGGDPEAKHRHPSRCSIIARCSRAPRPRDEAEQAFRTEIDKYPTEPRPYKNLILLYATEGKNDQATQLIFSLEKAAPTPPSYVAISETLKIIGDNNGARFWAARGLSKYPNDRHLQALFRG